MRDKVDLSGEVRGPIVAHPRREVLLRALGVAGPLLVIPLGGRLAARSHEHGLPDRLVDWRVVVILGLLGPLLLECINLSAL